MIRTTCSLLFGAIAIAGAVAAERLLSEHTEEAEIWLPAHYAVVEQGEASDPIRASVEEVRLPGPALVLPLDRFRERFSSSNVRVVVCTDGLITYFIRDDEEYCVARVYPFEAQPGFQRLIQDVELAGTTLRARFFATPQPPGDVNGDMTLRFFEPEGRQVFVELYPFAYVDPEDPTALRRFDGRSLEQLRDVATKFGRLQREIWTDRETLKDIKPYKPGVPEDDDPISTMEAAWQLGSNTEHARHLKRYAGGNSDLVMEGIRLGMTAYDDQSTEWLLHDVHPHNTFVVGDKCVLVFDWDWLGEWSPRMVLAFSLHRFVREYARRRPWRLKEAITEGTEVFLDAYAAELQQEPHESLVLRPTEVRDFICAGNVLKLTDALGYVIDPTTDKRKRPIEHLESEVRKFTRFMVEAMAFPGSD